MKRYVELLFSDPALIVWCVVLGGLRVGLYFAGVGAGAEAVGAGIASSSPLYHGYMHLSHLFFGGLLVAAWQASRPFLWWLFWGLGLTEVTVSASAYVDLHGNPFA